MPIAMRRNAQHRVVLTTDQELPESEQPVFLARVMVGEDQFLVTETLEQLKGKTGTEQARHLYPILEELIVGWENLPGMDGELIASKSRPLARMLTIGEAWDLLSQVLSANTLTQDERGNSGSHSSSRACAGVAGQVSVLTPPTSESLQKSSASGATDTAQDATCVEAADTDSSLNAPESSSAHQLCGSSSSQT